MRTLTADVRYALRLLARTPLFTLSAVVTLGLGLGGAAAVFGLFDAVVRRPLPYAYPERLVAVWESNDARGVARNEASVANFIDWRERSRSFKHLTALTYRTATLTGRGEPQRLQVAAVTVDFFRMLGVAPALGRDFRTEEEHSDATPAVMLSYPLWQGLGSDPSILGRTLILNGAPVTVVGVTPRDFRFEHPTSREIDVWVPRVVTPGSWASRRSRALYVAGSLRPGITLEAAQAELREIAKILERDYPAENTGWSVRLIPLRDQIVGEVRAWLWTVLAAVAVVLLVVCVNVASLLLSRGAARAREIAVRSALGASPGRIARQFLVESTVLGTLGAALGLVLAASLLTLLKTTPLGVDIPRLAETRIDPRLITAMVGLAIGSSALIGLTSALQARRLDLLRALRAGQGATVRRRTQSLLVVGEIAMAACLLVVAGLLVQSFKGLQRVDPGFDATRVVTMQLSLPAARYDTNVKIAAFYERLSAELAAVPGVTAAGATINLPLGGSNGTSRFEVEGRSARPGEELEFDFRVTTPGYFAAMNIPILRGRGFTAADTADAAPAMVVNQRLAEVVWPGEDPIGRRVRFRATGAWFTVVGVLGNVRHGSLAQAPRGEMYLPQARVPNDYMYVVARTTLPFGTVAPSLREVVRRLDPEVPIYRLAPFEELRAASTARERFSAVTLTSFGLLTLLLAAAGLYGIVAYTVARRTREMGIRLALGAVPAAVGRMLIGEALRLAIAGVSIGLLLALAASRTLGSLLFGITATDVTTYVGAAGVLMGVVVVTAWVPARRAMRIDPVESLREG